MTTTINPVNAQKVWVFSANDDGTLSPADISGGGGTPGGAVGDVQLNSGSSGFDAVAALVAGWTFNFDPTANSGTGQLTISAPTGASFGMLPNGVVFNTSFLGLCNSFGSTEIDIGNTSGGCVLRFFNNGGGASLQTVTGSRGGNAALASLLTGLAAYGFIIDSSTA